MGRMRLRMVPPSIYEVNTICKYDPAIIPLLDAPIGSAFGWVAVTESFQQEFDGGDDDA